MEITKSIQITKGDLSQFTHVAVAKDKNNFLMILYNKKFLPTTKTLVNSLFDNSVREKKGWYLIYTDLPKEVVLEVEAAIAYLLRNNKFLFLSNTAFIQGYVLGSTDFDLLNKTCFGY
tara:strand:+ start:564 stop:917 length:354 start_codon:yes stop_codon:yes gene_type:complete